MAVSWEAYLTASHAMIDAGWGLRNPALPPGEPAPGTMVTVARIAAPTMPPDDAAPRQSYFKAGRADSAPAPARSCELREWTGAEWEHTPLLEVVEPSEADDGYLAASHAMLDAGWTVTNPVLPYAEPAPGTTITVARIAPPALSARLANLVNLRTVYYQAGRARVPPWARSAEVRCWTGTKWDCWPEVAYASCFVGDTICNELLRILDEIMLLAKDAIGEAAEQRDIRAANDHREQVRVLHLRFAHLADDAYGSLTGSALAHGASLSALAGMGPAGEMVALVGEVALLARQGISPAAAGDRCWAKDLWCETNTTANALRRLIASSSVLDQPLR